MISLRLHATFVIERRLRKYFYTRVSSLTMVMTVVSLMFCDLNILQDQPFYRLFEEKTNICIWFRFKGSSLHRGHDFLPISVEQTGTLYDFDFHTYSYDPQYGSETPAPFCIPKHIIRSESFGTHSRTHTFTMTSVFAHAPLLSSGHAHHPAVRPLSPRLMTVPPCAITTIATAPTSLLIAGATAACS